MRRIIPAILLIAVLAVGESAIATTAYQAGLSTAVTTAAESTGTVVAPVVVPAYGYGWGLHPGFGFGIFGFLGTLFFVFIVFALIRAIVWGGRGRRGWGGPGPGGWGGPGGYGTDPDHGGSPWASRAHGTFEEWHRQAHADPTPGSGSGGETPPNPA